MANIGIEVMKISVDEIIPGITAKERKERIILTLKGKNIRDGKNFSCVVVDNKELAEQVRRIVREAKAHNEYDIKLNGTMPQGHIIINYEQKINGRNIIISAEEVLAGKKS